MKFDQMFVRGSRLGLSFIMLLSVQVQPAWAARTSNAPNTGLIPIETSQVNKGIMDDLFGPNSGANTQDRNKLINGGENNTESPAGFGGANLGENKNNRNKDNGNNNSGTTNNNKNKNSQTYTKAPPMTQIGVANTNDEFRCNLFESVPYESIISALNTLNQAVNSPNCADNKVNVQAINENNKTIADAVEKLRGFKENPDTVQPESTTEIVTNVDAAIRAATTVANSFAQTDIMKKECRDAMSTGDVAVAVGDLLNGLTPYALMAASMTGGTAAIPFIVGGSIITGAVSSMSKIIGENSANVKDAQVRRAIVENTCQYIRLDQKYKFIIKSRQEQISKITNDISNSRRLFSAKLGGVSGGTNSLIDRKNALDQTALDLKARNKALRAKLDLDKQTGNADSLQVCQLGIQLAAMAQDKSSYVSEMMGSLDQAMIAYGTNTVARAQALKATSKIAVKSLDSVAAKQFSGKVDFNQCAQTTKSLIEALEQSTTLSEQLVRIAQENIDKNLKTNAEYSRFKVNLVSLNEKQFQAERVTLSLDNLKAFATSISQSEIDSEMERLRRGLFQSSFIGGTSPVLMWFKYVRGLHESSITRYQQGLQNLRMRAFRMTKSSLTMPTTYAATNQAQLKKDKEDADKLEPFNLTKLPLGTAEHDNVCRELNDVWNSWAVALDHLQAMNSFCGMIEPYVFDNRPEDRDLVSMCRGFTRESSGKAMYGAIPSTMMAIQKGLVKNGLPAWSEFLQKKMTSLVCLDGAKPLE